MIALCQPAGYGAGVCFFKIVLGGNFIDGGKFDVDAGRRAFVHHDQHADVVTGLIGEVPFGFAGIILAHYRGTPAGLQNFALEIEAFWKVCDMVGGMGDFFRFT